MSPFVAYAVIVAALVALLWPGSRGGQAVLNVTGGLGSALAGAGTSVLGGNQQ